MTDTIAVVEASRNKKDIEATVNDWLDNNAVTSVDDMEVERRGRNKVLILIAYSA